MLKSHCVNVNIAHDYLGNSFEFSFTIFSSKDVGIKRVVQTEIQLVGANIESVRLNHF